MNNMQLCEELGIRKDSLKKRVRRIRPFIKENIHFFYDEAMTAGGKQRLCFWTKEGISLIKNKDVRSNVYEKEFHKILRKIFRDMLTIIPQFQTEKYRVDFYIPELNLIVEYYETYHKQRKVRDVDTIRENYIRNKYNFIDIEMGKELEGINKILQFYKIKEIL